MKIKELSPDILEQLVELECKNILPVLASVGLNLTPQHMREQLEYFRESDVVLSLDSGRVDGFAMYDVQGTEVTIISFNLQKFNNLRVLSTLLGAIFQNLQTTVVERVKSRAHHTNTRSLNFHRRMGFKEVARTEHHIEFQISKADLLVMMERRVRQW